MSAQAVIKQFKALPPKQRAEVAKFVMESDDSWIPASFKRGMEDAAAGRFADMDTILSGATKPQKKSLG
jgi:predicted transcriptional regulator